jgi:hypothetical protein
VCLVNLQIVITGVGAVSPVGVGGDEFWNSLIGGKSGIVKLPAWANDYPAKVQATTHVLLVHLFWGLGPDCVRVFGSESCGAGWVEEGGPGDNGRRCAWGRGVYRLIVHWDRSLHYSMVVPGLCAF